jgi:ParB-like chromosome segregation protein Spo0J
MKTSLPTLVRICDLKPHTLNMTIYGEPDFSAEFKQSIIDNGVLVPLLVDEHGQIISGHNRWKVADEVGFEKVLVTVLIGATPLEVESLLIESNRQRVKTPTQVQNETVEYFRVEEAFAAERRAETLKQNQSVSDVSPRLTTEEMPKTQGKTRDIVAQKTGQSNKTVDMRMKIAKAVERQEPKAKEAMQVLAKGGSVAQAVKLVEPERPKKSKPLNKSEEDQKFAEEMQRVKQRLKDWEQEAASNAVMNRTPVYSEEGIEAAAEIIRAGKIALLTKAHPDRGGSHSRSQAINEGAAMLTMLVGEGEYLLYEKEMRNDVA